MDGPPLSTRSIVQWSTVVLDPTTGERLWEVDPDRVLRTASVAKLFLLTEVARRLDDGSLSADQLLDRRCTPAIADSGLWHRLRTPVLPLADVAALVGAVSDNWATNVLLELCGLPAVQHLTRELGVHGSALLDLVRDPRTAAHPPTLSEGSATDWSRVLTALSRGEWAGPAVSRQVLDWMALSVDHSLVAGALGLDPLVDGRSQAPQVFTKTGSDEGVRADVGLVRGHGRTLVYACVANWDPAALDTPPVLEDFRTIGRWLGCNS